MTRPVRRRSVVSSHVTNPFLPSDLFFVYQQKLSKRAIELNNGRAAQMGILGLMVHELIVPLGYDPDLPIIGHLK